MAKALFARAIPTAKSDATRCVRRGYSPVYLLTDHTGFYERYGWEFLCLAHGDGEEKPSRMYIRR